MRVSPHDRSRTRRTLRSYQPIWTWPQQPQAVFLSADGARSPALSDHQKCRAPSVPAEGQGSYTHPTAVAFDEIAPPCLWLDKFQARLKCRIPTPCTAFLDFQPPKSPTQIHEDPQKNDGFGSRLFDVITRTENLARRSPGSPSVRI